MKRYYYKMVKNKDEVVIEIWVKLNGRSKGYLVRRLGNAQQLQVKLMQLELEPAIKSLNETAMQLLKKM